MTITDLSAPRELNAEHGNWSEAARRRNPSHRHVTAPAPGMRLQFAALAEQAEMNSAGKAATAQHEQRGEGLLQANRAKRHVPCRTRDGLGDKPSLLRINLTAARYALGDSKQAQRQWQRQQRQHDPHRQQKQYCLAAAPPLHGG